MASQVEANPQSLRKEGLRANTLDGDSQSTVAGVDKADAVDSRRAQFIDELQAQAAGARYGSAAYVRREGHHAPTHNSYCTFVCLRCAIFGAAPLAR